MTNSTVAIVGLPHTQKATLFNHLIGAKPTMTHKLGLASSQRLGSYDYGQETVQAVHLPGIHSLHESAAKPALDERMAQEYLRSGHADRIVHVIDAQQLQPSLALTTELLELQKPLVIAIQQFDQAERLINTRALGRQLACPVLPLTARIGPQTVALLRQAVFEARQQQRWVMPFGSPLDEVLHDLATEIKWYVEEQSLENARLLTKCLRPSPMLRRSIQHLLTASTQHAVFPWVQRISPYWLAIRLLAGDLLVQRLVTEDIRSQAAAIAMWLNDDQGRTVSAQLTAARALFIERLLTDCTASVAAPADRHMPSLPPLELGAKPVGLLT